MAIYNRRIHGVVEVAKKDAAEAAIVQLTGDPGYLGCFTVPLSPTGQSPVTHYGSSAQMTQAQQDALLSLLTTVPGVYSYRGVAYGVDDEENVPVKRAGEPAPVGVPASELRWEWDAVLEDLGLKIVIVTELSVEYLV